MKKLWRLICVICNSDFEKRRGRMAAAQSESAARGQSMTNLTIDLSKILREAGCTQAVNEAGRGTGQP